MHSHDLPHEEGQRARGCGAGSGVTRPAAEEAGKTASRDLQEKLYNLCVARRDGNKTVVQVLCGIGYTILF